MARMLAVLVLVPLAAAAPARAAFVPEATVPVSPDPTALVAADFDGDGRLDLAAGGNATGVVDVLLRRAGGYEVEPPSSSGTGTIDLAVADFNADGRPDIASAANGSSVRVLLRKAAGGFDVDGSVMALPNVSGIAAGDLTGDGRPDVAAASIGATPTVRWWAATGDPGSLFVNTDSEVSDGAKYDVAIAEVTGDALPDTITANQADSSLSVFAGTGAGLFAPAVRDAGVGASPEQLATADFNADGRVDVAVANRLGDSVTLLLGKAGGGLVAAPGSPYPTGDGPFALAPADLDGDGDVDLAAANYDAGTVTILDGNGQGALAPAARPVPVGATPWGLAAADLDADGRIDLAVSNFNADTVTVLRNTGTEPPPPQPQNPDLDGDGVQRPLDCRDDDLSIRPGARDVPGDGIDQDCDEADADYPRLQRSVKYEVVPRGRGYAFKELTVAPVRAGDRVVLRCRGRGCPLTRATIRIARDRRALPLAGRFERVALRKAVVTVVVTRPGTLGRHGRFRFKPGTSPEYRSRCVRPGVAKPVACPA